MTLDKLISYYANRPGKEDRETCKYLIELRRLRTDYNNLLEENKSSQGGLAVNDNANILPGIMFDILE